MSIVITIVGFLLIFGLLIFVHEFGHFIVARRNGIKVEEFGFGLPLLPKIFSVRKGETLYTIYPVPLGGFVKMLGEDGKSKSKRSFASQSMGVRARVLVAGVTMNLLLAYILLTIGFLFNMQPIALCPSDIPNAKYQNTVSIAAVSDGGAASKAGLKTGDTITKIGSTSINCNTQVPHILQQSPGQAVTMDIKRDGQAQSVSVTPAASGASKGRIGIAPKDNYTELSYPKWEAPIIAGMETVAISAATLTAIVDVFAKLFSSGSVPQGVAGPVGIAKLTGDAIALGSLVVLRFIAIISLSLAIFNLLPIPALDGGRLLFVGIEALRGGKPISQKTEQAIHAAGFFLLLALIVVITYFDLTR
ncbi:RIP metalloprotease RseP [Patescibacteria group bacterium]|nr:RIP metalloprotease RseP [Patescibacteria group bacterium]